MFCRMQGIKCRTATEGDCQTINHSTDDVIYLSTGPICSVPTTNTTYDSHHHSGMIDEHTVDGITALLDTLTPTIHHQSSSLSAI